STAFSTSPASGTTTSFTCCSSRCREADRSVYSWSGTDAWHHGRSDVQHGTSGASTQSCGGASGLDPSGASHAGGWLCRPGTNQERPVPSASSKCTAEATGETSVGGGEQRRGGPCAGTASGAQSQSLTTRRRCFPIGYAKPR